MIKKTSLLGDEFSVTEAEKPASRGQSAADAGDDDRASPAARRSGFFILGSAGRVRKNSPTFVTLTPAN